MKSFVIAIAALSLVVSANAATLVPYNSGVFVNPNFTSGSVLVSDTGASLGNTGRVAVVYATTGTLNITATTTASEMLGQLSLASPTISTINAGLLNGSNNGVDTGNALVGRQIYILMGNNQTILSSTAIALYTAGTLFPTQDGAGNATSPVIEVRPDSGVVFGGARVATGIAAPFGNANGKLSVALVSTNDLASIPEPSAALLGALGVLGLLRRRRN
jgi:MYXO-CTERM domain-containing protein